MKRKVRKFQKCFFFILLLFLVVSLYSWDNGLKFIDNYSFSDYKLLPQNWCIAQAYKGFIYVGNQGNLLEYDGVSWTEIEIPNYAVRSMDIDQSGIIYVGGINEFGYLAPDTQGKLNYVSLLEYVEKNVRIFGPVWRTVCTKHGVFFRTSSYLFQWIPKQKQARIVLRSIFPGKERISGCFSIMDKVLVSQRNVGLMEYDGIHLKKIPGSEIFGEFGIVFMAVPFGDSGEDVLIGTRKHGFYVYNGKTFRTLPTDVNEFILEKKASHGIRLRHSNGDIAVATLLGGIVVIDKNGKLKHHINRDSGLLDNNVKYLYEDIHGNLWAALNKGISKIEYFSPFYIYDNRADLIDDVHAVTRNSNRLYAGTNQGLFFIESGRQKFEEFGGLSGTCRSLLTVDETVMLATSSGIFQIEQDNLLKISNIPVNTLVRSRYNQKRIWAATENGVLSLFLKSGSGGSRWGVERIIDINKYVGTFAEDQNGDLWVGVYQKGIYKIEFNSPKQIEDYRIIDINKLHQLPPGIVKVFWVADHIMFSFKDGLYRFDSSKNKFVQDFTFGSLFSNKSSYAHHLAEDKNKNIWFSSFGQNYGAVRQPDNSFLIIKNPLVRIPIEWQVNAIYPDPMEDVVWFATNSGLLRFNAKFPKDYTQPFRTLIRRVSVNFIPRLYGPEFKPQVFEYSERNIRFEFVASCFENESSLRFQYMLEGFDERWFVWSNKNHKEYTNLHEGEYKFRVQSRNIYGVIGQEAVFSFKILAPWYRTWWAYGLYILFAILLFFLLVKWRSNNLLRDKQRLERVVKERTEELDRKNRLLVNQARQLEELDRAKSRFFANISHEFRTPLTLILGPLEKMLSGNPSEKTRKNLVVMQRNSQRLLHLINSLLNLSQIDSGKMKLNAAPGDIVAFIRNTIAPFEAITINKNLHLEFNSPEETVTLYYDTEKAEEIFLNLLSNAVKFTPPGGRITITLDVFQEKEEDLPNGYVQISVRDTGPGISHDQMERIFERFVTFGSDTQKAKGTGIGLALTRELVLLHHGKIDLHSCVGEGTEFVISLPLGDAHLGEDEKAAVVELSEPRFTGLVDLLDEKGEKIESGEDLEREGSDKPTVLVVEDNPDMRRFIRGAIQEDYIVLEAADGKKGIEIAKSKAPDLVVSDIMMPEMDGYQLCRQLKQDIETSHIPVVLLTAKAAESSIIEGLETGADDYIIKPFNANILNSRIKNLIQLRHQLQEKFQRELILKPTEIKVTSIDEKFLDRLKDILEKNISDPDLNVQALSEKMEISTVTLNKKIRYLTGETAIDLIRSYRLKRAIKLLESNYGSVTDVALAVGFNSVSYFVKCFKEKFGRSPSEIAYTEG